MSSHHAHAPLCLGIGICILLEDDVNLDLAFFRSLGLGRCDVFLLEYCLDALGTLCGLFELGLYGIRISYMSAEGC